mgnify:CR=1 FL=1
MHEPAAAMGDDEAELLALLSELRAQAGDREGRTAALRARLRAEAPERIAAYDAALETLLERADVWPLHGAYLLAHGARDAASFRAFRAWVVSLGGAVFEAALSDPDVLADALAQETPAAPELLGAFREAYRGRTGQALAEPTLDLFAEPRGEPILDSELPVRFPRLAAATRAAR